jgi:hypothetical protein
MLGLGVALADPKTSQCLHLSFVPGIFGSNIDGLRAHYKCRFLEFVSTAALCRRRSFFFLFFFTSSRLGAPKSVRIYGRDEVKCLERPGRGTLDGVSVARMSAH